MRFNGSAQATRGRTGGRFWVLMTSGLLVALMAATLVYTYLRSAVPTQTVIVAARDISPFSPATAADFTVDTRPKSSVPDDAITDMAAVNGLVVKGALLKGDVLRAGYLTRQTGSALTAALSNTPELRVISLTTDAMEGLQGQVAVGDQLDIIGVMSVQNAKVNETRVGTLATNVVVLAVTSTPKESSALSSTSQSGAVLVSVTPAQAAAIKLAQATGKVYVQLSASKSGVPTPVMTPETILGR